MNLAVTDRIVEMVFSPDEEVAAWFNRIGFEAQQTGDEVLLINPYLNFRTAIFENMDPVSRAVALGFALAGMYWPKIFPDLLKETNKEWKKREEAQEARAGETRNPAGAEKEPKTQGQEGKKKGGRPWPLSVPGQSTFEDLFRSPTSNKN
jgi:hypothetical protein